jgi:uncharacterized membrane protein YGL010W
VRNLTEHLTEYAGYHRDRRNIATHFVGIPMIVVSIFTLLGGLHFYAAVAGVVATLIFYFRLDVRFGLAMVLVGAASLSAATALSAHWLVSGTGLFVAGWVIQFVGHYFEGKKPAFVDDLIGLLVGPLFLVAEVAFMLGLRTEVKSAIEAKVGPTLVRARGSVAAS